MSLAIEPEVEDGEDRQSELEVLTRYVELTDRLSEINRMIKVAEVELDNNVYAKYPTLSTDEIKEVVVNDKWMQTIEISIKSEIDQISQSLTNRINELAERYESPLPFIDKKVEELENKVNSHLEKLGFVWK